MIPIIRITTVWTVILLAITVAASAADGQQRLTDEMLPDGVVDQLLAAGNTSSDIERLRIMRDILKRDDLPDGFREDLDNLTKLVDDWATGSGVPAGKPDAYLTYMLRYKRVKAIQPKASGKTTLAYIYRMYMARTAYCGYVQTFGKFAHDKEKRDKALLGMHQNFAAASSKFPENDVMALFAGKKQLPWPKSYEPDPNAPEWANLQRVGLEGLTDVVHWWIDTRQKEAGYFGSGWGDDVEMWRRGWTPGMIAFDDPKAVASWEKLATGIFAQGHMKHGYSSVMTDAEHCSEDSADTLTPMMAVQRDNPVWRDRALHIIELAEKKWRGVNERGQVQHKSMFFNAERIDTDPRHAADATYYCRTYQPALLYWQRSNDPKLTAFFAPWIRTWVDASLRAERGKPAGILPTAIRWPDGVVGGLEDPWWNPNLLNGVLYRWPGAAANSMMCNVFLLAWMQTGDATFLDPLHAMAQIRRDYLAGKIAKSEEPGTLGWCAEQLPKSLMTALTKYRLISGDTRHDDLLTADAAGYVRYRITGDNDRLLDELRENAEACSHNFELFTSECRAGDRLLVPAERYFGYSEHVKAIARPIPEAIYAMATGDPDPTMYCVISAVRWLTPPRQIGVMVTRSNKQSFAAKLYHFGDKARAMAAQLYMLDVASYRWTLRPIKGGAAIASGTFDRTGPVTDVALTLPPRQHCILTIERSEP